MPTVQQQVVRLVVQLGSTHKCEFIRRGYAVDVVWWKGDPTKLTERRLRQYREARDKFIEQGAIEHGINIMITELHSNYRKMLGLASVEPGGTA